MKNAKTTTKAKKVVRGRGKAKKASEAGPEAILSQRLRLLEEGLERVRARQFHADAAVAAARLTAAAPLAAQDRFVRETADGWLLVLVAGVKTSLPSGLNVSLTGTAAGRDNAIVSEGALAGTAFDVTSGNLAATYRRLEGLVMTVKKKVGPPTVIDGVAYDLVVSIAYKEGGMAKSAGPFAAKTDPANPVPSGSNAIEIADFPHDLGAQYGDHGTVWFRIGHSGDRYVHPGRISEGCLTCAPTRWKEIFDLLHCARVGDSKSVGTLAVDAILVS